MSVAAVVELPVGEVSVAAVVELPVGEVSVAASER